MTATVRITGDGASVDGRLVEVPAGLDPVRCCLDRVCRDDGPVRALIVDERDAWEYRVVVHPDGRVEEDLDPPPAVRVAAGRLRVGPVAAVVAVLAMASWLVGGRHAHRAAVLLARLDRAAGRGAADRPARQHHHAGPHDDVLTGPGARADDNDQGRAHDHLKAGQDHRATPPVDHPPTAGHHPPSRHHDAARAATGGRRCGRGADRGRRAAR